MIIEIRELADDPPVRHISMPEGGQWHCCPFDTDAIAEIMGCDVRTALLSRYRGVSLERLPYVIANGIDVDPSDAPIWADAFDKAWAYGGWPKVVMMLDASKLDRTFKQLRPDVSEAELELAMQTHPTYCGRNQSGRHTVSRFAESAGGGSGYDLAYGYYIPGHAKEALLGIMVFVRPEDLPESAGSLSTE